MDFLSCLADTNICYGAATQQTGAARPRGGTVCSNLFFYWPSLPPTTGQLRQQANALNALRASPLHPFLTFSLSCMSVVWRTSLAACFSPNVAHTHESNTTATEPLVTRAEQAQARVLQWALAGARLRRCTDNSRERKRKARWRNRRR